MRPSAYDPNRGPELARLAVQAAHTELFDRRLITVASAHSSGVIRGVTAVDLGCANGALTVNRFAGRRFSHVLGVDRDPELIAEAVERTVGDPKFTFVTLDLETGDLEREIRVWAERHGRTDVDLVFTALVLHHLADPAAVLVRARAATASPGSIVVRAADDGSKLAWPDPDGDLPRIIELTSAADGASDRFHGRKLMEQMVTAGYRDVVVEGDNLSTSGRTGAERAAMFTDSFSWRTEYLALAVRTNPENAARGQDLIDMVHRLDALEARFADPGFWYSETAFAAVGRN